MLSKLFRSRARFDDADPTVRRDVVVGLNTEEIEQFQADLAELASKDADEGVRRAAIERLNDIAALERLLDDAQVARAAAERLSEFIASTPRLVEQPLVRNASIRLATSVDAVADHINAVAGTEDLLDLAIASRNPKVRLAVADKVTPESALTELERLSRDRDKNVNRLARSKLDDIRHMRHTRDKALHRATDLVTQLATIADTDPTLAARLGVARQDWQANLSRLDETNVGLAAHGIDRVAVEELSAQFADHLTRLEATVASRPTPTRPSRTTPPAAHGPGTDELFTPVLEALEAAFSHLATGARDPIAEQGAVHAEYSAIQERWLAEADHTPPPDAVADRFHALTHSFTQLFSAVDRAATAASRFEAALAAPVVLERPADADGFQALWRAQRDARRTLDGINRSLRDIGWPQGVTAPKPIKDIQKRCQRLKEFDDFCHALHEELKDTLADNLKRLETDVSDGHLNSAIGDESDVKHLMRSLPEGSARKLEQEFHSLDARVQELKDWRTYATGPKREELCGVIEALAKEPLNPPEQADRIKSLREEWKSLGPVTSHADRKLLERFNAAAELAFKPCREYFEQQSVDRKFNLEQRVKICDDLEGYLDTNDWEHYQDWKGAERILRAARDEWRKFHPVDRSPGRKVQTRFEGLTDRLHGLIKAQWDVNVAAKQAIVAEAEAVRDSGADARDATDQIKNLQRRWKAVGVTPRRVDQRLWRSFRAICDEVFGQREKVFEERRESLDGHIKEATSICEGFEEALNAATAESATTKELTDFVRRFGDIPELPRDAARTLEQRFRGTEKSYRALLRDGERRAMLRHLQALSDADGQLCTVETQRASGTSANVPDDLPAVFAQRLKSLVAFDDVAGLQGAMVENQDRRHRLTIEMEIVAGMETPSEDQQRRLELQVERLNQGMKQRREVIDDPQQLAEQFCATGPAGDAGPEMRDRFFKACIAACE